MDLRDAPSWIAIELTHLGETKVDDGTLVPTLRRDLGGVADLGVFIPAITYYRQHQKIVIHLMEGYVFIQSGLPEVRYFALERKPYIAQVMSSIAGPHRLRTLSVITDSQVKEMQARLRSLVSADLAVGASIKVIDGTYRNLEGAVTDLDGDHAIVSIDLRSLHILARIPRIFLESLPDAA